MAEATRLAQGIAATTTKSAMFNKEMILRSPAMDPISALSYETMAYREIVWHPDVAGLGMQQAMHRLAVDDQAGPHPRADGEVAQALGVAAGAPA